MSGNLKIGTCSWKYPSWHKLVYSQKTGLNYLKQYSQRFNTVEIDQWFYTLPKPDDVDNYINSVPKGFTFTIKVPQAITLTHHREFDKTKQLLRNEEFFSEYLFYDFHNSLEPMKDHIDMLMFQFEYLNKNKMKNLTQFLRNFREFLEKIRKDIPMGIETRNGNYLKTLYFEFLYSNKLYHVFSERKYMPHVWEVYDKYHEYIRDKALIRLLGGMRKEIESKTNKEWNKIVIPRDEELGRIAGMVNDMLSRNIDVIVNVNNHYEGSAPITIERLKRKISGDH